MEFLVVSHKRHLYNKKNLFSMTIPKQAEELAFLIASIFIFVGSFLAQITIWASKRTNKSEALTSSKANSSACFGINYS